MDLTTALMGSGLANMLAVVGGVVLIVQVLLMIAHWGMFSKAGEKGWKAIIPLYSDYTLYKLMWRPKGFWVFYGLLILAGMLSSLNHTYGFDAAGNLVQVGDPNTLLDFLTSAAYIVMMITYVVLNAKTAIAFGKGFAFAIGLVLLPNIFTLILGFGSATYRGPQD